MPVQKYPHIKITTAPEIKKFTSIGSGSTEPKIPERNREEHSQMLRTQLNTTFKNIQKEIDEYNLSDKRKGAYLEFKSEAGSELITNSLDNDQANIRLLNVHTNQAENITSATVFVPNGKNDFFSKKLHQYQYDDTKGGKPRHKPLIESISEINPTEIESFWCDSLNLIPEEEPKWCEVWIRVDSLTPKEDVENFERLLTEHNIQYTPNVIEFPERAVKLVNANREQLVLLSRYSDHIAEFRLAKESAHFWTETPPREQTDWVNDLLARIETNEDSNVPICILDTGVNNGHDLLAPVLDDLDCHAVDNTWGTHDHDGHGTMMAGISAYGELETHLASSGTINLMHKLESVKILPPPPDANLPRLWGAMTSQAVSLAEIQAPSKERIHCMAITSSDVRDRGKPSSWSATIDNLTSGVSGNTQKLMIISAGNSNEADRSISANYPASLMTDSIHDPAQSWNAVTVGAFTTLQNITDPTLVGYNPLAPHNGLSPFTTTSLVWDDKNWPIKPEIVMEGGNLADDSINALDCENLSMLTTNFAPHLGHFRHFNMTSLATAQASWFAAQIQAKYPEFWAETIRALMIHSARWTEELISQFSIDMNKKTDVKKLLRICGYGVPTLERALHSASNSLTLIVEEEIQPFIKEGSKYKTKDMHFYELPWPKDVLQDMPSGIEIEMRVTLSYFIEPGPGEIGEKDKYRYASHLLHFELNSPGETDDELIRRINKSARTLENGKPDTKSAASHWVIGEQARDKGSIHSDIWKGTAADLADSNKIVIYPGIGWWRERKRLGKYNNKTRYALVVTISTPKQDIDLYTPVLSQIEVPVSIEVNI